MPKVSVIVPIYNVEKYLEKCINSLLSQTLEDIQIILVNDGSKDNSGNIAREYEKQNNLCRKRKWRTIRFKKLWTKICNW